MIREKKKNLVECWFRYQYNVEIKKVLKLVTKSHFLRIFFFLIFSDDGKL